MSFIIHSYAIGTSGKGTPVADDKIAALIKDKQLAWIHLDANAPQSREFLTQELTYLDPLIVDALLAEETRPRLLEHEDGILMILRGVNLNDNAAPEDMCSIRLWIDPHRIISLQKRNLKAVKDIAERLETGKGPSNCGDFITLLISNLQTRMEPVLTEIDDKIDDLEEIVMQEPDASERQKIVTIRKQAILLRRYIAPQRDAISQLRSADIKWLDKNHKRALQEATDRITRLVEDLDTMREKAQIIKDELANALSDRLNKNMYVLSVIAAIFLPLGFLTGLLGINVGGIPGADNGASFGIFCGILTALVALQIAIFKKLKWF